MNQEYKLILIVEELGFGLGLLLIWLDEIIDIPHLLFGAVETPINYTECLIETFFLMILGVFVILFSRKLMKKIKVLEGFLTICSYCRRMKDNEEWISIEDYIDKYSNARFTHAICPNCYADQVKKIQDYNNLPE